MSQRGKALSVLTVSTLAFTVCFMVWMMFGVIGIPIKKTLGLTNAQFGLLTAMPVLTGSLIRVPLGVWTDRFGGRIVFFLTMLACVIPIYLMSYATQYWHFLVLGLFVGLAGLVYHFLAGVKHLIADWGIGESLEGGRRFATAVLLLSAAGIAATFVWVVL